jgi:hypothetical protein
MSSSIVLYKSLGELKIDFPKIEQQLTRGVVTAIQNAVKDGAIVDRKGVLWIRSDKLNVLLRTDPPTAKKFSYKYQKVSGDVKLETINT